MRRSSPLRRRWSGPRRIAHTTGFTAVEEPKTGGGCGGPITYVSLASARTSRKALDLISDNYGRREGDGPDAPDARPKHDHVVSEIAEGLLDSFVPLALIGGGGPEWLWLAPPGS